MIPNPGASIPHWFTVAVESLPTGWRNVYREDDGTLQLSPCPALLIQEHRLTTPSGSNKDVPEVPPYSTRVVFADRDGAELEPAGDSSNYLTTIGPDEPLPDSSTPGSAS